MSDRGGRQGCDVIVIDGDPTGPRAFQLAHWCQQRRGGMRLSTEALARRVGGISLSYIEAIERGAYDPGDVPADIVARLQGLLGELPEAIRPVDDGRDQDGDEIPAGRASPSSPAAGSAPAGLTGSEPAGASCDELYSPDFGPQPVHLYRDADDWRVTVTYRDGYCDVLTADTARALAAELIKYADLAQA